MDLVFKCRARLVNRSVVMEFCSNIAVMMEIQMMVMDVPLLVWYKASLGVRVVTRPILQFVFWKQNHFFTWIWYKLQKKMIKTLLLSNLNSVKDCYLPTISNNKMLVISSWNSTVLKTTFGPSKIKKSILNWISIKPSKTILLEFLLRWIMYLYSELSNLIRFSRSNPTLSLWFLNQSKTNIKIRLWKSSLQPYLSLL